MQKSLLLLVLYILIQIQSLSQNCALADAGPDRTICPGSSSILGTPAISGYSYYWSPSDFLNSPYRPQPITNTLYNTTYTLTMYPLAGNLIRNGDFESGFTGFGTDYGIFPNGIGCSQNPYGSVAVVSNPSSLSSGYCNQSSHPPIGNQMLFTDGTCQLNRRVWYQSVSVVPGTTYNFSAWASAGSSYGDARLRVRINGVNVIQSLYAAVYCNKWFEFYTSWMSGSATTALIEIFDDNLSELNNDFCIDDIYFSDCLSRDQVTVNVDQTGVPTIFPKGPITYYNDYESPHDFTLTCSPASNYQWYKNGVVIQGANSQTYTIHLDGYLAYTDYYSVKISCGRSVNTSQSVQFTYKGCIYDYQYPPGALTQVFCQTAITSPNYYQLPPSSTASGWSTTWWLENPTNGLSSSYSISNSGQLTQISNLGSFSYPYFYDGIFTKSYMGEEEIYMYYSIDSDSRCRAIKKDAQIALYPNPATSNSKVTLRSSSEISEIELYELIGSSPLKQLKGFKNKEVTFSIFGLKEGIYTVKVITTSKQISYLKLMIKK